MSEGIQPDHKTMRELREKLLVHIWGDIDYSETDRASWERQNFGRPSLRDERMTEIDRRLIEALRAGRLNAWFNSEGPLLRIPKEHWDSPDMEMRLSHGRGAPQ